MSGWHEVVIPAEVNATACDHLLKHYRAGSLQEDLCFGFWNPSRGSARDTAIVTGILLPRANDRQLHGNVSFYGRYLSRATREAIRRRQGLVFMHSHPSTGWQALSVADERAERGRVSDVARTTGMPLVGMTIGSDGHWSARIWRDVSGGKRLFWSKKIRVVEPDRLIPWLQPSRVAHDRSKQRRTIESWGEHKQRLIENVRLCVVGLGSVGSIVSEGLARIGCTDIVLIDHDVVRYHNLDRMLNATANDVGSPKVDVAAQAVRKSSSTRRIQVMSVKRRIQDIDAYAIARDCDLIFSCVDSPVARDVLNRIAIRDGIPVVDGGVEIRKAPGTGHMNAARWKAHVVNPYGECLRCKRQYTSSDVMLELDGSWKNPRYIRSASRDPRTENVFLTSLAVGSDMLNLAIRMLVADAWWPTHTGLERNLVTGRTKNRRGQCETHCSIHNERWSGDRASTIRYLRCVERTKKRERWPVRFHRWLRTYTKKNGGTGE